MQQSVLYLVPESRRVPSRSWYTETYQIYRLWCNLRKLKIIPHVLIFICVTHDFLVNKWVLTWMWRSRQESRLLTKENSDGVLVCAHTQSCKSVVEMGLGTNHRHPAVCRNIHLMAVYTRADWLSLKHTLADCVAAERFNLFLPHSSLLIQTEL